MLANQVAGVETRLAGAAAARQVVHAARPLSARVQAVPASTLKLDQPKRLWEAGSTEWFHGIEPPSYLTGELPGDAGFDPLGLADTSSIQAGSAGFTGVGDDPEKNLLWLLEGELYNGRVAMLGVVGILGQELLGLKPWWQLPAQANLAPLLPDGPVKYAAVVAVGHALYGYFEWNRIKSFKKNNTSLNFDPLNLRTDRTRQAEVRNGRLAMLAALGFAFQAVITGKTPLENLNDHLADPLQNNILTQSSEGWYVEGAFLVFSVAINLIGLAKSRENAKVRTFFSDFSAEA